jgi:hypothetical protein
MRPAGFYRPFTLRPPVLEKFLPAAFPPPAKNPLARPQARKITSSRLNIRTASASASAA